MLGTGWIQLQVNGVTPGGGYDCNDYGDQGFPIFSKTPDSNVLD